MPYVPPRPARRRAPRWFVFGCLPILVLLTLVFLIGQLVGPENPDSLAPVTGQTTTSTPTAAFDFCFLKRLGR